MPSLVGMVLAGGGLLLSWWGPVAFRVFAALIAAMVARELTLFVVDERVPVPGWFVALGAAAFPAAAGIWGLRGLVVTVAIVVPLVSARFLFRKLYPGSMVHVASAYLVLVYAGLLIAFLPLIRESLGGEAGTRLLAALVLMIAAAQVGWWAGDRRLGGPEIAEGGLAPTWWGGLLGIVASVGGALVSWTFLGGPFAVISLAVIGAVVGLGAVVGRLAGNLVAAGSGLDLRAVAMPGRGGLFFAVQPVLIAAPAFFFGLRLYLV